VFGGEQIHFGHKSLKAYISLHKS